MALGLVFPLKRLTNPVLFDMTIPEYCRCMSLQAQLWHSFKNSQAFQGTPVFRATWKAPTLPKYNHTMQTARPQNYLPPNGAFCHLKDRFPQTCKNGSRITSPIKNWFSRPKTQNECFNYVWSLMLLFGIPVIQLCQNYQNNKHNNNQNVMVLPYWFIGSKWWELPNFWVPWHLAFRDSQVPNSGRPWSSRRPPEDQDTKIRQLWTESEVKWVVTAHLQPIFIHFQLTGAKLTQGIFGNDPSHH